MTTAIVKISSQGQLTLPKAMREMLGVEPGGELKLKFNSDDNKVELERAKTLEEQLRALRDSFTPKMKAAIRKNRGKTASQMKDEWAKSSEGKKYFKEKYGL